MHVSGQMIKLLQASVCIEVPYRVAHFPPHFLLFLIEPLAVALRQDRNIKGIQPKNIEHKISI